MRKYADPDITALTERIERLEYALNRMTEWNDSRQNLAEIGKKDEPPDNPNGCRLCCPPLICSLLRPNHHHAGCLYAEAVTLLRRNHLETQEVELYNATDAFLARYDEVTG